MVSQQERRDHSLLMPMFKTNRLLEIDQTPSIVDQVSPPASD